MTTTKKDPSSKRGLKKSSEPQKTKQPTTDQVVADEPLENEVDEPKIIPKRSYELMVILPPDISEKEIKARLQEIKEEIEKRGGEITHEDYWGKKEFTYQIKKFDAGFYTVLNFNFPANKLNEFSKVIRLNTGVLRYLITQVPSDFQVFVFTENKEMLEYEVKAVEEKAPEYKKPVKAETKFPKSAEEKPSKPEAKELVSADVAEPKLEKKDPEPVSEVKAEPVSEVKAEPVSEVKAEPELKPEPEQAAKAEEKPVKEDHKAEKPSGEDERWKKLDEKLDELLSSDKL